MEVILAPALALLGATTGAGVVAHQGGWDEMLMVGVPIAVFAGLLYSANKRAARLQEQRRDGEAAAPPEEPRNERAGPT